MKWINLKSNKCPKCNGDLTKGLTVHTAPHGAKLLSHHCGFGISEARFNEIVMDQTGRALKQIEQDYGEGTP